MSQDIQGSCKCGAIKVALIGGFGENGPFICHCIGCRKSSGCLGAVVKLFSNDKVKIEGNPKEYVVTQGTSSGKTVRRFFCADCGSPTHAQSEAASNITSVRLSLFDGPLPAPVGEAFWKYTSDWEKKMAPEDRVLLEM